MRALDGLHPSGHGSVKGRSYSGLRCLTSAPLVPPPNIRQACGATGLHGVLDWTLECDHVTGIMIQHYITTFESVATKQSSDKRNGINKNSQM